jgi:hypothetical protein
MSEFENNLWLEFVREHGDELASGARTVRKERRTSRPRLLAGTSVGLAATATAAAVLLGASTSPAAFAVTRNPDGTVTVNLMQPSGIAGANRKLAAMGVRAQIELQAKTPPRLVCPGGTAPTITFDPARIPSRQVLMIAPAQPNTNDAAAAKANPGSANTSLGTTGGTARAKAGAGASSGDANHVVRMLSGSGKIRTQSRSGNHVARMYCP